MSMTLSQSLTAVAPGITSSFLAAGGVAPITYSVRPGGAGGTIDSSTGLYTAPAQASELPEKAYDTILAKDAGGALASRTILVATPLLLFCEILQSELGLEPGRAFLWDQKVFQPTDAGLYIAVSVTDAKPFANTLSTDTSGSGVNAIQSINMVAALGIDVISRGPDALVRKEEVLMALASYYSQSQQQANSFFIGTLPAGGRFVNLSNIDGAAIPYRFNISINIQYFTQKIKAVPYFNRFSAVGVTTQP